MHLHTWICVWVLIVDLKSGSHANIVRTPAFDIKMLFNVNGISRNVSVWLVDVLVDSEAPAAGTTSIEGSVSLAGLQCHRETCACMLHSSVSIENL